MADQSTDLHNHVALPQSQILSSPIDLANSYSVDSAPKWGSLDLTQQIGEGASVILDGPSPGLHIWNLIDLTTHLL